MYVRLETAVVRENPDEIDPRTPELGNCSGTIFEYIVARLDVAVERAPDVGIR